MYAAYKEEFEGVYTVIETGIGFANFSIEEDGNVYVQEVYVKPSKRGKKWASVLTEYCIIEAELITNKPINRVYTSVGLKGKTIDKSLRAITDFGFKVLKANEEIIYFYKDLDNE